MFKTKYFLQYLASEAKLRFFNCVYKNMNLHKHLQSTRYCTYSWDIFKSPIIISSMRFHRHRVRRQCFITTNRFTYVVFCRRSLYLPSYVIIDYALCTCTYTFVSAHKKINKYNTNIVTVGEKRYRWNDGWFKNVQQNPKIDKCRSYVSFAVFILSIGLFSILIVRQFFGRS